LLHFCIESRLINTNPFLAGDQPGKIQRKTECVEQLKSSFARYLVFGSSNDIVNPFQAFIQCF
jgi:hypothetical protein